MRCVRTAAGAMQVVAENGQVIASLTPAGADRAAFDDLAGRLAELVEAGPVPRVAVRYREGLLDDVQADIACNVMLIEEDRFGDPAIQTRLRAVVADADAVSTILARAGDAGADG